jgi:hypothetical protein
MSGILDLAILAARIDGGSSSTILGPQGARETEVAGLTTQGFREDVGPAAVLKPLGLSFQKATTGVGTTAGLASILKFK